MRVLPAASLLILCLAVSLTAAEVPLVDTATQDTPQEATSHMVQRGDFRYLEIMSIVPGSAGGVNKVQSTTIPGGNPANGVTTLEIPKDFIEEVEEANFSVSAIYGSDAVSGVVAFVTMNHDFDIGLYGLQTTGGWRPLFKTGVGAYGESQLTLVNGNPVFGGLNLLTHKVDVWEYRPNLNTAVQIGTFPQSGNIKGALEGGYRFNISGIPNTNQFTAFGMNSANQFNFWHLEIRPEGIHQINICPVPMQPRTGTHTETSGSTSPDGKTALTTIDSLNRYRTWLFTPDPVNVKEIWNGSTRRSAPPGIIGGFSIKFAGSVTLNQAYERPDGDVDFVETLVNNAGDFLSEEARTAATEDRTSNIAPMSVWQDVPGNFPPMRYGYGAVFARSMKILRMPGCANSDQQFCATDNRFRVTVTWRDPQGNAGSGQAVPLTSDTGYYWFFNEANIELIIKVLDACIINQRFWVFAGGLTNVEVEIKVVDTVSGVEKVYRNPQGTAFLPVQDTSAFAGCATAKMGEPGTVTAEALQQQLADINAMLNLPAKYFAAPKNEGTVAVQATCSPSATQFCLSGNRFKVEADWEAPNGQKGKGTAVRLTDDSGYFWFFNATNVEMLTKVLNACNPFGAKWVFAAGLTNVKVELKVTDMQTGVVRRYENPQGQPFQPIQDTAAFTVCP